MSAFHNAQPRARAQVPSSTAIWARNASRLVPAKAVQAMARSHAGSPTAQQPKSITALSRPFRARRLQDDDGGWGDDGSAGHAGQVQEGALGHPRCAAVNAAPTAFELQPEPRLTAAMADCGGVITCSSKASGISPAR
jgi:hypothetical protein